MPWKETCAMDERMRFISAYLEGCLPMTVLCESFGISRQAGYDLVQRYRAEGPAGLSPRSRAPHHHPQAMDAGIAARIVALRQRYPFWGPKKLRAHLGREDSATSWPAASTIGDLLRREGLSMPRKRRRTAIPLSRPFQAVNAVNDTWCIDFKGWFRTRDGQRCDPLTLTDADSRYLLACQIVAPTQAGVAPVVERIMREHGLPRAMRSDNGPPFASIGAGGLTRLSVFWVKLGIRLERIMPGCPQQNGRHERMHNTLKQQTTRPPAQGPAEQQARFDHFRQEFNHIRPHEALDQQTPASRYHASPRPYPDHIDDPWYDADHAVRRVRSSGEIKWGGDLIFISEALIGELVGLAETEAGDFCVRFADVDLGLIDRHTKKFRRFTSARPGRCEAEQTEKTVSHLAGL